MHESRSVVGEGGVGVLARDGRSRPCGGGGEKPSITHHDVADHTHGDIEQVLEAQIVERLSGGHRLSRSRSSASSVRTLSMAARSRSGRPETYSAMADFATTV
jgi:hypothetical protein